MSTNDGGPAFPFVMCDGKYYRGMSLRDWFAGMASQGILACAGPHLAGEGEGALRWASVAEGAYSLADAMMAQREKKP